MSSRNYSNLITKKSDKKQRRDFLAPVALFLDFDGTLSPIASIPSLARPVPGLRKILQQLSRNSRIRIAIISGRSLEDIKKKISVPGLIYAGNHGLELSSGSFQLIHPSAQKKIPLMNEIAQRLKSVIQSVAGALLEHKTLTLSVHYRRVEKTKREHLQNAVLKTVSHYLEEDLIKITWGKCVLEIRPNVRWDKAALIRWLLLRKHKFGIPKKPFLVYFGDDETDESAFSEINQKGGLSVKVGHEKTKTNAKFLIAHPKHVCLWLKQLGKLYAGTTDKN